MLVHSEEILILYCCDDYRIQESGFHMLLASCRTHRACGFWEVNICFTWAVVCWDMPYPWTVLDSGMILTWALMFQPIIFFQYTLGKETSSTVDFQNLRRGSIYQQQRYQGTGKTWQETRGKPGARKCEKSLKKGLSIRLRKEELAREEAVRVFSKDRWKDKGKEAKFQKWPLCDKVHKSHLIILKLAEFPWHQKLMLSPFLQQEFPSLF